MGPMYHRIVSFIVCIAIVSPAHSASFAGHWSGTLEKGGERLSIQLDIADTGSQPNVTISFPYRNWLNRSARLVDIKRNHIRLEAGQEPTCVFDGKLEKDALNGTMTCSEFTANWSAERAVKHMPYSETEVSFQNGDVTLAGVLVIPTTQGPHPAIVMLHGSGDNEREWYTFPADFFARQGFAVLYFDKRGNGKSGGDWRKVGFDVLAEDGLAGLKFLQTRPEIDPKRIGMWGISQAGWIMTLAASKSRNVAFVVCISGGCIPVEREGFWDYEWKLRDAGCTEEEVAKAVDLLRRDNAITRSRSQADYEALLADVKQMRQEPWFSKFGFVAMPVNSPIRDSYSLILDFDPQQYLPDVASPILWLDGDRDESWPTEEAHAYLARVKSERNKDWTLRVFEGTRHGIWNDTPIAPWPFTTKPQEFWDVQAHWLREKGFGR